MPILKITRSNEYANRFRNIQLVLDGEVITSISNGETKEMEISPGEHILQAKIDWCSSNKVTFSVPEHGSKSFALSSFAKKSVFGIFASIYYISFGANKYLNLDETTS